MLRIRKLNAEPDHTPSPASASLPRYGATAAYLTGAVLSSVTLLQQTSGSANPWIVLGAAVAFIAGVVLNIYVTPRESRPLTAFMRFSATSLLGAVVVEPLTGGTRVWAGIVLTLVLLLQFIEPAIFAAQRRNPIWSRGLPGAQDSRDPVQWPDVLVVVGLAPWIGAVVSAFLNDSPTAWFIGAGINLAVGAAMFVIAAWVNVTLPRRQAAFAKVLREYDPEFVLYTARPDDASYQVSMWLPYLQRTGKRFVIVTRSDRPAAALAALTDAPVLKLATQRSLEWLLTPSMGAVFYVNASSGNNALVRHGGISHVYLGHGDSDKPPSYNPTHAMYDRVFAAGEGAIDRYAAHGVHIPRDKFRIVGRPQVSDITVAAGHDVVPADQATVLYAPTWRGHVGATAFQSLHLGERLVQGLLDQGSTVIFRPHPFSYDFPEDAAAIARIQSLLAADAAKTGRAHRFGQSAERDVSVIECMNLADAMISDVSSVVSDFLYSGKPFAMMAVSEPADSFVDTYPVAKGAYVVEADLSNYDEVLASMFGEDPLAPARRETRAYYLGDFADENYDAHFIGAVGDAIAEGLVKRAERKHYRQDKEDGSDHSEDSSTDVDSESALDAVDNLKSAGDMRPLYETLRLARSARRTPTIRSILRAIVPITAASLAIAFPHWALPLVALIGIAVGMVALIQRRRERGLSLRSLYGIEKQSWAILTVGLASVLADYAAQPGFPTALVVLVPVLGAAFCIAGYFLQLRGVLASHLPGIRVDATEVPWYVIPAAITALLALVGGFAAAIAPAFAADAGSGLVWLTWIALVVTTATLGGGAVRAWRSALDESQLHDIVTAYGPQFEVYFGANAAGDYQFGMWAPYFDRIDRKYIVVARDPAAMLRLADLTSAPVVLRPTLRELDDIDVPSLSTVFYVNNATRNTHMVERAQLMNVWLNHGDSEKPACYNPVHAIYNYIFSAGQAGVDRYERHGVTIPAEKFKIVGRPQVEEIELLTTPVGQVDQPTVLYAPTWIGPYSDTDVYSLPIAKAMMESLLQRNVRVIFRAHPLNYTKDEAIAYIAELHEMLAQDAQATGREHLWGEAAESEMSVTDCFNASDAMICDISAVISDYLQSTKPFAVMAMSKSQDELLEEVPAVKSGYTIRGDLSNLEDQLDAMLGTDPLGEDRRAMRTYYLGGFPADQYANHFLNIARGVIDAGRRP